MSSGIAKISPDFAEWVTVEGEQVRLCGSCRSGPSSPRRTTHRRRHRRRRTARSRLLKAPNVAVPAPCHGQRRGAARCAQYGVGARQVILSLQLARFLLKAVDEAAMGRPLASSVQYIAARSSAADLFAKPAIDPPGVLSMLEHRAR
jgi:hypothetical protein